MKIKMQVLLAITVIILVFIGSIIFTTFSYRFLLQELEKQIAKDNQVLGEQLLKVVTKLELPQLSEDNQKDVLQGICEEVQLPNSGFVCAVSADGMLLAKPGLPPGKTMSFDGTYLSSIGDDKRIGYLELPTDQAFNGKFQMGNETDIVAIVPVQNSGIRLAVHQNQAKVKENAQDIIRPLILIGISISLVLGLATYLFANRVILKYEHKLEKINRELTLEKQKTDKLLLNVLPVRVANELKERGKSTPESFEEVTVFFSDIVGFTHLSSKLEPNFLIDELNEIFTAFDQIMEKNKCERIKTIGDGYMAVSGMPVRNPNHAENMVQAATEIVKYMENRNSRTETQWKVRIGIHTGKVVGGIVGIEKYIYDVFGDTINTASRMETHSEPMKINISETTYQLIKNKFKCDQREPLEVKGKGKMMMCFVEVQ